MCCLQRDNPIAARAESLRERDGSVQPIGHPINASTKSGFKSRPLGKISFPFSVRGGWVTRDLTDCKPKRPLVGSAAFAAEPSFQSRAVGVNHLAWPGKHQPIRE